ncbi:MAG: acetate--CoA ligase family protein [Deltaproteobacteria bacterium]|jgi:acyl-CoA synthetase (NDP forming)|nr:acetate--CoA ligase family protein [Deltaproteobacteria bacterium]MBT4528056.1 acetate--CoA ligase family protein [Deltaproteobacteria bacterium]
MLEQCADKGVPFVTIFSSGFAEAGDKGKQMQEQIVQFARENNMRICSPNCQGSVDLYHHVAAAFSAALDPVPFKKGSVGFITQSGALGYSIFNLAQENRIGFSYITSTGNEVDLNCLDYMDFMLNDIHTKMIFTYLEGLNNGKQFIEIADKALTKGKPIAVLKVGKSETGMRAAASHTAALTGSDQVFDAFFKQKGIIRVDTIEEFIDVAKVIEGIQEIPRGNRLAVMKEQFAILNQANFPYFNSPARAVRTLSKVMKYGTLRHEQLANNQIEVKSIQPEQSNSDEALRILSESTKGSLTGRQSKNLLSIFKINTSREALAVSKEEAVAVAERVGYPLAMKIDSPDILHKMEAQVIKLNIHDKAEMVQAFEDIMKNAATYKPEAKLNGVLIQEMIPEGVEVIVGINHDPQFGPVLMFGLGGIFVEILKDISLRILPINRNDALSMIKEIRGYRLLTGARGRKMADIDALADTLVKVSIMAVALGDQLEELDINPLVVLPKGQGVKVADALAIIK